MVFQVGSNINNVRLYSYIPSTGMYIQYYNLVEMMVVVEIVDATHGPELALSPRDVITTILLAQSTGLSITTYNSFLSHHHELADNFGIFGIHKCPLAPKLPQLISSTGN